MRIPACHRLTNRCDHGLLGDLSSGCIRFIFSIFRFTIHSFQIFYTLFSAIVGFLLGASDGLGEIHSVDAVHELFEQFPEAFMKYLHVPNQRDYILRDKAYAAKFAPFWNEIVKTLREEDYITNLCMDIVMMYGAYSTTRRLAVMRIVLHFLWFGVASAFVSYLYVKGLQNPKSVFYKTYIFVLIAYASVQLAFSLLMRIPACHRLTNRCDQWLVRRFIKWMHQLFFSDLRKGIMLDEECMSEQLTLSSKSVFSCGNIFVLCSNMEYCVSLILCI
ncbi:callose synthase 9-like isoform X2 [Nymphaea colorata]|uniref:callose synthase 9-like isoform X2 n=1 Tax=Nymphaea colorata TaxID=210225 RepID=UPI00214E97CF|nr:callose synthase 9-like isoform X2 [Nymphaea colorata]